MCWCVCVCVCGCVREVYVCVCVRERASERVCVSGEGGVHGGLSLKLSRCNLFEEMK